MNKLPKILSDGDGRKVERAAGVCDPSDQSTNNTSDPDLVKKTNITKRTHFRFRTSSYASTPYADLPLCGPQKRTIFKQILDSVASVCSCSTPLPRRPVSPESHERGSLGEGGSKASIIKPAPVLAPKQRKGLIDL